MTTSIVTGGAGFLGSHLVDALVKRGEYVVVLDNLSTGRLANLEQAISAGRVTFIYTDVATDTKTLRGVLADSGVGRIDAIYHLASPAKPNADEMHLWESLAVNGMGTMSLIDIALEKDARFIFSSTSDACADPVDPLKVRGAYFEDTDPRSRYDEGKRVGEAAVATAVRKSQLNGRIIRFFDCYGPRMQNGDGHVITAFVNAVFNRRPLEIEGMGTQTLSITYVDDALEALLIVAAHPEAILLPVNVGSEDELSILKIAETLIATVGTSSVLEYVAGRNRDPERGRPDLTRARRLGWKPTTSLAAGLRMTYEWFATDSRLFI